MSVRLTKTLPEPNISASKLRDGQMAIMLPCTNYTGVIVQRVGRDMITVGENHGESWPGFFNSHGNQESELRVRVLEDGEQLTVYDNM